MTKGIKPNLDDILGRIKLIKNLKTDKEAAELIGLTSSALSKRREYAKAHPESDTTPYEGIIEFSSKEKVSLDYLIFGEDE